MRKREREWDKWGIRDGRAVAVLLIHEYNAFIGGVILLVHNASIEGVMVPTTWARVDLGPGYNAVRPRRCNSDHDASKADVIQKG